MEKKIDMNKIELDKRKGQYILSNEDVIKRQVDYAELTGKETVLEIGPGLGALTLKLAERADRVVAIEKDYRLYSHLKNKIPPNVELINADVMDIDIPKFQVVVSNLPYQISSPVTFKLLNLEFSRAILMYQKEFALRMIANAGDKNYSRLSVNVYYNAECKLMEFVSREAFRPKPNVDSAIVKLTLRSPPFSVVSENWFFKVVEALFSQRRKKIKNSLASLIASQLGNKGIDGKSALKYIINELPFKDERVERLSPKEIGELADCTLLSIQNIEEKIKPT
ncbi:MAG: ribosomal RNA small subunit methyltransferase A [Thermoplasmata archaeon]|nr:MAG: ribosomal RNA small subunit methyltransferase A [Thermoplasmata archaeon]